MDFQSSSIFDLDSKLLSSPFSKLPHAMTPSFASFVVCCSAIGALSACFNALAASATASADTPNVVRPAARTADFAQRFSIQSFVAPQALTIQIPSLGMSHRSVHLYKPGFEREVIATACAALGAVTCTFSLTDVDPRGRKNPLGAFDLLMWGGDIRFSGRAHDAGLVDSIEVLAVTGRLLAIKQRFMKRDRPWPKPLRVGVDAETSDQAAGLCRKIRATCTFTVVSKFTDLTDRFDKGQLDWVAHSQSWLFQNKDLEDRLTTEMDPESDIRNIDPGIVQQKKI